MEDIEIIQLLPDRWKEYRELRLEALQKDPQAFGQNYDKALNFPDSYWIDHLERSQTKNKILVYFAENKGKIIGMIGAFFYINPETEDSAQIFGVYVNEKFRGIGVAHGLQEKLLSEIQNIKDLRKVRVMVNKTQTDAVNLYQHGNFKLIKTEKEILGDGKEYSVDTLEQQLNNVAMKQSHPV